MQMITRIYFNRHIFETKSCLLESKFIAIIEKRAQIVFFEKFAHKVYEGKLLANRFEKLIGIDSLLRFWQHEV